MKRARSLPSTAQALPLYTVEDAESALELLRPVSFTDEIELADGLSCRFTRVGHILGAAAIRIGFDMAGGARFLIDSGDLGRYERLILKDPDPIDMPIGYCWSRPMETERIRQTRKTNWRKSLTR